MNECESSSRNSGIFFKVSFIEIFQGGINSRPVCRNTDQTLCTVLFKYYTIWVHSHTIVAVLS